MNSTTQLSQRKPYSPATAPALERSLTVAPAVDIVEDAQGITVWADLPGVSKEGLEVKVHDGNLTIEAKAGIERPEGLRVQHAEIRTPHYLRAFSLSSDFDTARIEAQLQDGVLRLTIPRREEARPRKIEVRTR
jgi:HSP20 family protein